MPRTRRSSHIVSADEAVPAFAETIEKTEEDNTVAVMLLRAKVVKVTGKFTGREYVFDGAGSVINDVDRTDAEEMINKHLPPSCCGSYPTPYFQIIGR